jgi:hypothetical protein
MVGYTIFHTVFCPPDGVIRLSGGFFAEFYVVIMWEKRLSVIERGVIMMHSRTNILRLAL